MFIAHVIATALLAVIAVNSAVAKLRRNEQVVAVIHGTVGVPLRYLPVLAALEIADRILHLHAALGHSRQILQMDVGGMPHADFLRSIELLGTEVLPQVRKELDQ